MHKMLETRQGFSAGDVSALLQNALLFKHILFIIIISQISLRVSMSNFLKITYTGPGRNHADFIND